ncbi:hypothetical protein GCM10007852_27290 [Agaribacter marinus]|uniref:Uncharacterized protein n=1 Tax=Agaribacter marinus TaxID=1431249 RepID=A0AA37WI58_9ALTE|nr:hypothetical protein GCM10007852_27290 [Agaribacter marinus]
MNEAEANERPTAIASFFMFLIPFPIIIKIFFKVSELAQVYYQIVHNSKQAGSFRWIVL